MLTWQEMNHHERRAYRDGYSAGYMAEDDSDVARHIRRDARDMARALGTEDFWEDGRLDGVADAASNLPFGTGTPWGLQ